MTVKGKVLIALAFGLSGCMVGPNYQAPEMATPASFAQENYCADGHFNLKQWWERFNDPELTRLVDLSIENNRTLLSALERIEEARALYGISQANAFPEIDAVATAARIRTSQSLIDAMGMSPAEKNFLQIGFDALWEIDLFGRLRRARESALADLEAEVESMRDLYLTLVSDVARGYIDYRALQQKIALAAIEISVWEERALLAIDREHAGLGDAAQTQAEMESLYTAEERLKALETALAQTRHLLAVLVGEAPANFAIQECGSIPNADSVVHAGLPSQLLRRRPDIRSAERRLASETANIGVAVADYFPTLSLTGRADLSSSKLRTWIKGKSRAFTIGPTINWPLINFGRVRSNVQAARASAKAAAMTYEHTVLQAFRDVEDALVAYFKQEGRLHDRAKSYVAAEAQSALAEDRFRSGLENRSSTLLVLLNQIHAEDKLIDSRKALTSNLIALYKALGGEWD